MRGSDAACRARCAYSASKDTGASRTGGNPPRVTRSEIASRTYG